MYFPQPQGLHYGGIRYSWPPLLLWFNRGSSRHGGGAGELDRLAGELDRWPVENGCISNICFLSFIVVFQGSPWLCEKNYPYIYIYHFLYRYRITRRFKTHFLRSSGGIFPSVWETCGSVSAKSLRGWRWQVSRPHQSQAPDTAAMDKNRMCDLPKLGWVHNINFALTVCKLLIFLGIHSGLKQIANVKVFRISSYLV